MWKFVVPLLALGNSVSAQFGAPSNGGTGPYKPAKYTTDSSLPSHTIYLPNTVPSGVMLPVLVWGNGACGANGLAFEQFLTQLASHGYLVVANGSPRGSGSSQASWLTQSFDWIQSAATRAKYSFVEPGRIVVAGQSCGGTEAYAVAQDSRVAAVGVFNSGYLDEGKARGEVPQLRKPVFYFLGGPGDIAYQNGERDYRLLSQGTPSWKGNLNVGHDGTYWVSDGIGGRFAVAATKFLDWILKGNTTSAAFFRGQEAGQQGWNVESKYLENIKATPL